MPEEMTVQRVSEILHNCTVVYARSNDPDKRFGNPFNRLPRERALIAQCILGGSVLEEVVLNSNGTMLLLRRRIGDQWRFELSYLGDLYSRVIADVHDYFRAEGLMA